jgi:hypothetical protein
MTAKKRNKGKGNSIAGRPDVKSLPGREQKQKSERSKPAAYTV